jgi:hypothetical protein
MLRGVCVAARLATPRAVRGTAFPRTRVGGGGRAVAVGCRLARWACVGSRRRIHTRAAVGDGVGGEQVQRPRFDSHEQLVQHLLALRGDPLEADGGRVVVHRGNPNARLMVIGEGPGAEVRRPCQSQPPRPLACTPSFVG